MNQGFIDLLDDLEKLMIKKGQVFRARAYRKAAESLILYSETITDMDQMKNIPNIGASILKKFQEEAADLYIMLKKNILKRIFNLFSLPS